MKYSAVLTVLGLLLASCSGGGEPAPAPLPPPPEEPRENGKAGVHESKLISTIAAVEAVDPESRMITLKGPRGETFSFRVDDQVKNLSRVKVGDKVSVDYYESVAMEVVKPGTSITDKDKVLEKSEPGEKPTELAFRRSTLIATVERIDRTTPSITLRDSQGKAVTVLVRKPERLDMVKVGDQLRITYSEAVAVAVEPAPYSAK